MPSPYPRSNRATQIVALALLVLAFAAAVALGGCSGSSGSTGPGSNPDSAVTSITLGADSLVGDSLSVVPGDSVQLTATPVDAQGRAVAGVTLVWTSSDTTVATVSSSGLARAIDIGEADISVDVAGSSSSVANTAAGPRALATRGGVVRTRGRRRSTVRMFTPPRIKITPTNPTINEGGHVKFVAYPVDASGSTPDRWSTRNRTWSSSDESVATIENTGAAAGVRHGKATIRASMTVTGPHTSGTFSSKTTLTVASCFGLSGVSSWNVDNLVVAYTPSFTVPKTTTTLIVSIAQQSTVGGGTLTKLVDSGDTTLWEGQVSGTFSVNNKVRTVDPTGHTTISTEVGQGNLGGQSTVVLGLIAGGAQQCTFWVQYDAVGTYVYTKDNGSQSTFTNTVDEASITGAVPSDAGTPGTPTVLRADETNALATPLFPLVRVGTYYLPGTILGELAATLNSHTSAAISVSLTSNVQ